MTVPTTTVASSAANSLTVLPTSSNAPIDRSGPAVTLTRIPCAPARLMSSRSGEDTAISAATFARCSPVPMPEPIIARPVSDITVRTSAKSTLMRPGRVMSSAMPCTAPCHTSLARLNASSSVVWPPSTCSSFWLGIVISESTCRESSVMPASATDARLLPSITNGRVTTATVRMPSSRATCATTGAAPVPVPPPMPAVMNSMSQPSISSMTRSRSSIAAWRPTSGLAPAPSPLVMLQPICSEVLTLECLSACASVFTQMNSTPSMPHLAMCDTALPPPPPTPITLITALWLYESISSNMSAPPLRSEIPLEPRLHPLDHGLHAVADQFRRRLADIRPAVEQQTHPGGVDRVFHDVAEPGHALRAAETDRHVEDFLGELDGALHLRAAAGQHDAGRDRLLEARAPELVADQREQFLVARLDDLGERLAREPARRTVADRGHLDGFVGIGELRQRAGVADLDLLRVRRRRAHRDRDVVGDLVARDRDHGGVADRAAGEHGDVGGAAADVHEADAEVLLVLGQHGERRGELLEDDVL